MCISRSLAATAAAEMFGTGGKSDRKPEGAGDQHLAHLGRAFADSEDPGVLVVDVGELVAS